MSDSPNLPIICLDFDGVIHRYGNGWQDGTVYDVVVPGFFSWAIEASKTFRLIVYSERSASPDGIVAMMAWMRGQLRERLMPTEIDAVLNLFTFASEKPKAFLTIDARAIQFRGDWSAWWLQPSALMNFRPWNARGNPREPAAYDTDPAWRQTAGSTVCSLLERELRLTQSSGSCGNGSFDVARRRRDREEIARAITLVKRVTDPRSA